MSPVFNLKLMVKKGDVYPKKMPCMATECAQITYSEGHLFDFLVYTSEHNSKEIEDINSGPVTLGLFTQSLTMFLVVKFDSLIFDAPINALQLSFLGREHSTSEVAVILIEQSTNKVLAVRTIMLTEDMADLIIHGTQLQLQFLTETEINEISHKVSAKYTAYDMLKMAKSTIS